MKQKLLLLLIVLAFILPARLAAFESGGIYYETSVNYDSEGNKVYTASVTPALEGGTYTGNIDIPSIVEYEELTYLVTSIQPWAFASCTSLLSVKLPTTVTILGNHAFYGCTSLTSIEIPNSVTSIEANAFDQCTSLTSIEIPNSVTSIGYGAFYDCDALTSVTIPNAVTSIEGSTFYGCDSLTSVKIPDSVTSIGSYAFSNCLSLRSLHLPKSIISVGNKAFYGTELRLFIQESPNVAFEDDSFPKGAWYIFVPQGFDTSSFQGEIRTFDPKTTTFTEDDIIIGDSGKTLYFVPVFDGRSYSIPEEVTKISSGAFNSMEKYNGGPSQNMNFSSLTIPSTIEEIEADVFRNTKIEKVIFNDWSKWYANIKLCNLYSNPYWNSAPFAGGIQIVTPQLAEGITEIPDYVNCGLQFKNEIEIPRSIKRIGAYAFYKNEELFSVILPAGLEEIGESAFEGCILLENPSFPVGLKKIENGAYKDCTALTEIELPEGLIYLGELDSNIAKGVFEGCSALEKAVVAVDIDYIADNLFKSCGLLDKIYLPLNLKTIGKSAFERCLSLDEITLPATLESIGDRAFIGHDGGSEGHLSKLIIPDAVRSLGTYTFAYQSIANLTIGKGIDKIPDYAFFENHQLQVINFSEGLQEIGNYAFGVNFYRDGSPHRGSVVLPSTVITIGNYAFKDTYISSLVIPDQVETLGPGSCGRPSTLTLGSYVKDIAADAFDFEKLYTIRLKAHMPPSLTDAFPLTTEINDQVTLIVNKGRHDTYNTTARWKQFDKILEEGESEVEIYLDGTFSLAEEIRMQSGYMPGVVTKMKVVGPLTATDLRVIKENMYSLTSLDMSEVDNITELPENQFAGSLLTNVILPFNLEVIGEGAFKDCRLLELTELPTTVKTIGSEAFSGCPSVNLFTIPESLESIGYQAFSGTGMREIIAPELLSEIGNGAFRDCSLLERVDLSEAAITIISDNVFYGCTELDEVILPEGIETIGESAFRNTAIRNIDFASEVPTIGDYAFSENRRLVSATMPEITTQVGSGLFADCPRLISVSMPMTTLGVGVNILRGDRKLSNISCSAVEAPDAETGALDDIRYRYVTLIIPTLSFRKYLAAPQWGKLQMKNSIRVNQNKGIRVTVAAEKEYQDMLKEDELEAAQEAAAPQNGTGSQTRAERRSAARAKSVQNFATLFDGAQITTGAESGAHRIFISPEPGVNVTSILFEGEELLSSFDGTSVLLPEGKYGTLEILTDAKPVAAESIELSDTELTLTNGENVTLTATVLPADTEDKTVTWSSSDESIATVDENGEITAVGVGNATITATCGEVSAVVAVKCYPQVGDANWNGSITITDAIDISNYVVKKKTAPESWDKEVWTEFYTVGANANESEDGKITISDAGAAAVIVLDQTDEASAFNLASATRSENDALVMASVSTSEDGKHTIALNLDNSRGYVALQADIYLPEGMSLEIKAGKRATKHTLQTKWHSDTHVRLVLYNFNGKTFSSTDESVIDLVAEGNVDDIDKIVISNILASDPDANEYVLDFRKDTSSVVEGVAENGIVITKSGGGITISNAEGRTINVFTLDGRVVKSFVANDSVETINLSTGIYVVKVGEKTVKIIL